MQDIMFFLKLFFGLGKGVASSFFFILTDRQNDTFVVNIIALYYWEALPRKPSLTALIKHNLFFTTSLQTGTYRSVNRKIWFVNEHRSTGQIEIRKYGNTCFLRVWSGHALLTQKPASCLRTIIACIRTVEWRPLFE